MTDPHVKGHDVVVRKAAPLEGLRVRGHVLDIAVKGSEYKVRAGDKRIRATVGRLTLVQAKKFSDGVGSRTPARGNNVLVPQLPRRLDRRKKSIPHLNTKTAVPPSPGAAVHSIPRRSGVSVLPRQDCHLDNTLLAGGQ